MTTVDEHDDFCEGQLAGQPGNCQCAQRGRGQLVLVPGKTCDEHPKQRLDKQGECAVCDSDWVRWDEDFERRMDQ